MKKLSFIILSLIYTQVYSDCGDRNGFLWTFTWEDKECNRCKEIGLIKDLTCKSTQTPYKGIDPMGITFSYEPPKSYFSPPKYFYGFRRGICHESPPWSWWAWGPTGCDWIEWREEQMDTAKIVNSLDECKNSKRNFQQFSDPFFNIANEKICLVKTTWWYNTFVCAYFYGEGYNFSIGCQPYPRLPSPPPFTPGLFPASTYALEKITSVQGFQENNTFQKPLAVINQIKGSNIIGRTEIQLDLGNSILQKSVGQFRASIDINKPDKIVVQQGSAVFGESPRPALEQNTQSDLSFFPCYHTYLDEKNQAYQGVFVFSINKQLGDVIGNGLFLGPHYIPSTIKDQLGDIRVTRCDLCINAFEQNSSWSTNIYNNIYKLRTGSEIGRCQLNNDVVIKKVNLVNISGNRIVYPKKNICDGYTSVEAPIRVDALDPSFASELASCIPCSGDQCPDPNSKIFKYEPDSAYLEKYLVSVKPVIPAFTNDLEADFITAIQVNASRCSTYSADVNGKLYIKPAGKRDRTYCSGSDPKGVYTLCGMPNGVVDNTVCRGAYSGTENNNADLPDKICIMTNGEWDFISGRYQSKYMKNLNGDDKIVPKMSCTFLPSCTSLGSDQIINVGHAIWDEKAAFGEEKTGKCKDISANLSDDDYVYRIDINSYELITGDTDPNFSNAKQELSDLKRDLQGKSYIDSLSLDKKSYLKKFLNDNPKSMKCTIVKPKGRCIGGIYGDLTPNTDCVNVKDNGKPVPCVTD